MRTACPRQGPGRDGLPWRPASELDEDTERRAYELLIERFPHAAIVTVVHRPSVAAYHTRRWTLVPLDGVVTLEAA